MIKTRPAQAPAAEYVISASTALLGLVLGTGAAFVLWSQLHHTAQPGILTAAVAALSAGLLLVGATIGRLPGRLFMLGAGIGLALAFFAGASTFAMLVS